MQEALIWPYALCNDTDMTSIKASFWCSRERYIRGLKPWLE